MENSLLKTNILKIGNDYTNDQIVKLCKVGNMGGMRRSLKTNSLIIISDHTKMYEDRTEIGIEGLEVLHYTGMGKNGDQSLEFAQNKTLKDSNINGVEVVLFEKFSRDGNYVFRGQVELVENPYQERQVGEDGKDRSVWMFPLQIVNEIIIINEEEIKSLQHYKEEKVEKDTKNLSLLELEELAKRAKDKGTRHTYTISYTRDPFVAAFAKRRANGICDLCEQPAQFTDKKGNPYLECHHVHFLSQGGPDTIENVVALCVVCHKKQHILEDIDEKIHLLKKYNSNYDTPLQDVW